MKPIQTRYAGYHFRSRLEARWAVFLDAMNIQYHYEYEGYEVGMRLEDISPRTTFKYLPDFWLPELNAWLEVKGHWKNTDEPWKFLNASAYLLDYVGGVGSRLILAGDSFRQPRYGSTVPISLTFRKGFLLGGSEFFEVKPRRHDFTVAYDSSECYIEDPNFLVRGLTVPEIDNRIREAMSVAQGARFEYGETPR